MRFGDEPVPGYPLPILPGHTSPGRLERVLRSAAFHHPPVWRAPRFGRRSEVYPAQSVDGYR